jgi:hypothetical protein
VISASLATEILLTSDIKAIKALERKTRKRNQLQKKKAPFSDNFKPILRWLEHTVLGKLTLMIGKFVAVLLFGAIVFYYDEGDYFGLDGGAKNEIYKGRTFVDALYFASVIACSVGYGHKLWPQTDSAKVFLIFYFLLATIVSLSIYTSLDTLYLVEHVSDLPHLIFI